jgi:hypothetical protein
LHQGLSQTQAHVQALDNKFEGHSATLTAITSSQERMERLLQELVARSGEASSLPSKQQRTH